MVSVNPLIAIGVLGSTAAKECSLCVLQCRRNQQTPYLGRELERHLVSAVCFRGHQPYRKRYLCPAGRRQDRCDLRRRHHPWHDGGITRGTHVLKALSVGAKACSGGRFYLYALAAAGQAGVERALENLRAEIERDMKLMGCGSVDQLSRDNLRFR
jgi:FMN-dependent dehydrogenase